FAGDSPPPDSAAPPDGSASAPGSPAPPDGSGAPPDGRGAAEPPVRPGILACIVNFSGVPHLRYQVGLPLPGRWREVINTDAFGYGGRGARHPGRVQSG